MAYFQALGNLDEDRRLAAVRSLLDDVVGSDKVEYTITRLVRGLCSGREASRIGFSIALTELLGQAQFDGDILELLLSKTEVAGNVSGQEERDHCFGRLFGIKAILESGVEVDWRRLLDIAFDLAQKKPWLREQIIFVICGQLHADRAIAAVESLHTHGLLKTSEGVALMLAAIGPLAASQLDIPATVWGGDPLSSVNVKQLKSVLLESAQGDIPQKGSWNHNPHFVWRQIFSILYSPSSNSPPRLGFAEFWASIVDDGLFADAASDERKFWGFQILAVCVSEVPTSLLEVVFSPRVRRALTNHLAPDRLLHGAAENVSDAISSRNDPEAAAAFVKLFIAHSGPSNDTLLKIANRAAAANPSGALQEFCRAIERPQDKSESRRLFLLDKLLHFLRGIKSDEVVEEAIAFLIKNAYIEPLKHVPKPPFTPQARNICKTRLHSYLLEISKGDTPTKPVLLAAKELQKLERKPKNNLVGNVDNDLKEICYRLLKSKLLCALSLFLLFDEDEDAVRIISDLKDCLALMQQVKTPDRAQGIGNHVSTICYDFVSHSSGLYRKAASVVFVAFSDFMGPHALNPYYLAVAEEFMATEEAQLFVLGEENIESEDSDAESTDSDEVSDALSLDSDVEVLSGSEAGETDAEKLANDTLLNEALGKLLRSKPLDVEMSDASDTDSATSSQMEKLDDQIAAAFRERAKFPEDKKKKKQEKEETVNHKLRCIDMLTAFVKKQHGRAVCLTLLVPMCGAIRMTRDEAVRQKANALIHQYEKSVKSDKDLIDFDPEFAWRVFEGIQDMASKDSPTKTALGAQSTAMLISSKALVRADPGNMEQILQSYSAALRTWMNDSTSGYHVSWFLDFISWCQSIRSTYQRPRGTKRTHEEMDEMEVE